MIVLSPEGLKTLLEASGARIQGKLDQPDLGGEERRRLQAELAEVKAKLKEPQEALEETQTRLAEAIQAAAEWKERFPASKLYEAQEALGRGDVQGAEALFAEISREESTHAAAAEFALGRLARARVDNDAAFAHFRRALFLQPDNQEYRLSLNGISVITIVHTPDTKGLAERAARVLGDAGFGVRSEWWAYFKEQSDPPLSWWVPGNSILYGPPITEDRIRYVESLLNSVYSAKRFNRVEGRLERPGTTWDFGGLNFQVWLRDAE